MEEVVLQHQHAPESLLAPLHPVLDGRGPLKQRLQPQNFDFQPRTVGGLQYSKLDVNQTVIGRCCQKNEKIRHSNV